MKGSHRKKFAKTVYENKAKHAGRQVVLTFTPTGESKNKS
jgi:hypothetical protein